MNTFRKAIHDARGESKMVIASFVDIRGFSSFMANPSDAALFLRHFYAKVLDEYFQEADFEKPTGDGLMIIREVEETLDRDALAALIEAEVSAGVRLVDDFPTFFDGHFMVNFPVPKLLGVGIARGSVTRLSSTTDTVDYTGRTLNLAARLMDQARPAGVVLDGQIGFGLLDTSTSARFESEFVYVRGIAEIEPIEIKVSSDVSISAAARTRPGRLDTQQGPPFKTTLDDLKALTGRFSAPMVDEPAPHTPLKVLMTFEQTELLLGIFTVAADYEFVDGDPCAVVHTDDMRRAFEQADELPGETEIVVRSEYQRAPSVE